MKTLLLIVGDLNGPPEFSEFDFCRSVMRNFRTSYNCRILVRPRESDAVKAILDSDALILFAHGSAGSVNLNPIDRLTKEDLVAKLYGKQFDFVWVAACHTLKDTDWTFMWLNHTERLIGFRTITFGKGASDPFLMLPDGTSTAILSPGFRDWYPHPRHIWPEKFPNNRWRFMNLWKWPVFIATLGCAILAYWLLR